MSNTEQLLNKIRHHNELYRNGTPEISDKEYDKLVEELYALNPNEEWFKHIEPAKVSNWRKVKLPVPMRSLYKVKSISELKSWIEKAGLDDDSLVTIMPKFDGLSLLYDEVNKNAYSRGGEDNEGQDCSAHYRANTSICNASSHLKYTYGEFVFKRETWNKEFDGKTSPETGLAYRSPRNTAAGLLNRDKPSETLKFVDFYRYGTDHESIKQFSTFSNFLMYLDVTFLQMSMHETHKVRNLSETLLETLYNQWSKTYYIDGLVIYVENILLWENLGRHRTTGNPNYAIAYKHPNFTETYETTVKSVTWKISKAGAFKPVVNIEAVDTGDCCIENPSGYNAKYIFDNKIGNGAKVLITRSGGVIPKIIQVIRPATDEVMMNIRNVEMATCPHCGSELVLNMSGTELLCKNKECPGTNFAKIVHFYKTVEAENIGEEILAKIFEAGYNTLNRVLHMNAIDLSFIDGFGPALTQNMLDANQMILEGVEITKLMHASSCFVGIGQIKAREILSKLTALQRYEFYSGRLHRWSNNEELRSTKMYWNASTTWQSFMSGIIPFNQFIADNGLNIIPMQEQKVKDGKFSGWVVCFTGGRDQEVAKIIEDNGGIATERFTKKVTHLIVCGDTVRTSKAKKAERYGTKMMSLSEFKWLLNAE